MYLSFLQYKKQFITYFPEYTKHKTFHDARGKVTFKSKKMLAVDQAFKKFNIAAEVPQDKEYFSEISEIISCM